MLLMLFALGVSMGSAEVIPFSNGREYIVSVCPDSVDSVWGTAYLSGGHGMHEAIDDVLAASKLHWFRRRDGSAVLLIESHRVVLAFTITRTGKVYPHKRLWNRDAAVTRCGSTTARVTDCEYMYSPAAEPVDPPNEEDTCVVTEFDWSRSEMKWKARIVGYH